MKKELIMLDDESRSFLIVALSLAANLRLTELYPEPFSTIDAAQEFQGRCCDLVYLLGKPPAAEEPTNE